MSTLFTFRARSNDDWSDDELDSDYHPGKDSDEDDFQKLQRKVAHLKNKRKRVKTSKKISQRKCKLRRTEQGINGDEGNKSNLDGFQHHLPPEVLIKIFRYGIAEEGFMSFIARVALVCKEWNLIARDPSVARRLDFSASQGMLSRKNQNLLMNFLKRDISLCHHLSLYGQVNLGSSVIEQILSRVPRLRTLNLYGCIIKQTLVKSLPQLCPLIRSLDLSSVPHNSALKNFNAASLVSLIQGLGPNLVELRLSNLLAVMLHTAHFLEVIQESCPQLEVLDLGAAGIIKNNYCGFMVDMAALAHGCPQLRELYLDGYTVTSISGKNNPNASSFRNLQVYSQSSNGQRNGDDVYFSLFSSVKRLKMLNISNSRLLPSIFTQWLTEVDELYLQEMRLSENDEREIVMCIASWRPYLRELDMSNNKQCNGIINEALFQFDSACEYPLEVLNLSNTNVTPCGIIHVIQTCKNLKEINLTSCRELPRGTKREFRREEFEYLRQLLEKGARDDL